MRTRLVIGIVCGVITAIIQLYLRPAWRYYGSVIAILLGSLPNFLAVLGLSFIFLALRKPAQRTSWVITAALVGVLAHEVFTGPTPVSSFGGHFDWNDVGASVMGAASAYWINQRLERSERKTV